MQRLGVLAIMTGRFLPVNSIVENLSCFSFGGVLPQSLCYLFSFRQALPVFRLSYPALRPFFPAFLLLCLELRQPFPVLRQRLPELLSLLPVYRSMIRDHGDRALKILVWMALCRGADSNRAV